jgi:nitrous oxidase accessory protein
MGISMSKSIALLLVLVLTASNITTLFPVKAEGRKIVVPYNYPTLTDAIGNATHGDTIFVKNGTYEEHSLVINKTLTLIGENISNTIIKNIDEHALVDWFGLPLNIGNTIAIQINADNVKISGFTIINSTIGITSVGNGTQIVGNAIKGLDSINGIVSTTAIVLEGNKNQVIGNIIEEASTGISVSGSYQTIAQNTIKGGRNCIYSSGQYNTIVSNIISDAYSGISVSSNSNVVHNNTVTGQTEGIEIIGSENIVVGNNASYNRVVGINIQPHWDESSDYKGDNIVCKNWIISNRDGLAINSGQNNTVYANYISGNQIGIRVIWDQSGYAFEGGIKYFEPDRNLWQTSYNNTFYNNNFVGNGQGAADWNWQGTNMWDKGGKGNYWSDYSGTDADHDGIGDTSYAVNKPYRIYDSFGDGNSRLYYPNMVNTNEVFDHYPLMSPFDIDSISIELPEWANVSEVELPAFDLAETEPFPAALAVVATGTAAATVAGAGLIVYFKKRKR